MVSVYSICAKNLYESLRIAWTSETAMEAVFSRCKRGPVFDRTDHGRAVIMRLFQDAWEAINPEDTGFIPTLYDKLQVLREFHRFCPDFNLFTQVAPNLTDLYLKVDVPALEKEKASLIQKFEVLGDSIHNPFSGKKAKVKVSSETHNQDLVALYTHATGIHKAASILPTLDAPGMSHRITPFGATPSFSDNYNFCQLPAAGDAFYRPHPDWPCTENLISGFFFMDEAHQLDHTIKEDGSFEFSGLPEGYNTFTSKSGGVMLLQVMAVRSLANTIWSVWAQQQPVPGLKAWMVIPRMNSVQVFAPKEAIPALEAATGLTFAPNRN